MSDNVLLVAAMALIVGFALGWLIAWLIWQRRGSEHEERIRSLETSLKGKEVSLLALRVRLQEREANLEHLRGQVSQSEQTTPNLTAQIEERNQAIAEVGGERAGRLDRGPEGARLGSRSQVRSMGGRASLTPLQKAHHHSVLFVWAQPIQETPQEMLTFVRIVI